jgi:hypothetical protein
VGAALAASLGTATAVHAQTDGLLVYMSFDDGGGDTANNTVGDDGVLVESPSWVAGEVGGALEFDGTTNYVEIPIDISPQAPGNKGQLSIAAWVKVLATETDGHAQTRAPIVLKGEGDGW